MFEIVLFEPEIPPNTGNIMRLCANSGARLHLIKPLGFEMDDKLLKRAGLDYREYASVRVHESYDEFVQDCGPKRIFAVTTKGARSYAEPDYTEGDAFIFGPETRGLPDALLATFDAEQKIRIPMLKNSRSLNLSNAAAILVYEAWRQQDFTAGY